MSSVLIGDDVQLAQAAQFLNVSLEHLMLLLEQGKLNLDKLVKYKQQQISQQALQQLVGQAQELNMGYRWQRISTSRCWTPVCSTLHR
jgi:hypothetical protein